MGHCINCEFWKNKQRELNYLPDWGICEVDLQHDWEDPKLIKIHAKHFYLDGLVDNDSTLLPHSMMFCTNKDFGCVRFEKIAKVEE